MTDRDLDLRSEEEPKKPYSTPTLTRYGTIDELTSGVTGQANTDATSKLGTTTAV